MLRISQKTLYAVEAVLHLAFQAGADPVSGKAIAKRLSLPPRYLEQLMQALVHAGILRGVRGPKGCYVLARERRRITIAEISQVVREMDGIELSKFQQTALGKEVIFPLYQQTYDTLHEQLGNLNIADLCERASQKNIANDTGNDTDYAI